MAALVEEVAFAICSLLLASAFAAFAVLTVSGEAEAEGAGEADGDAVGEGVGETAGVDFKAGTV